VKKYLLLILAIIIVFLISCGFNITRGVELNIIDAETNEPIPNILVKYQLFKVMPSNFVESKYSLVINKIAKTNEKGIVRIKPSFVFLWLFQSIDNEVIFINIDEENRTKNSYINFVDYFIFSNSKNYNNMNIIIPNNNYYPAMINSYSPPSEGGYMLIQVTNLVSDNNYGESDWKGERFVEYPAISDLKERSKIIFSVKLKRQN